MSYKIIHFGKQGVPPCPRCNGSHMLPLFEFEKKFMKVKETVYTHWGMCPIMTEPVIVTLQQFEGNSKVPDGDDWS